MDNKILDLIIALTLIAIGTLMITFGRRMNIFFEKLGLDLLPGDSQDNVRSRQILVSMVFIGIGIYLIIDSF